MYLIIDTTDNNEIFLGLADKKDVLSNTKIPAKFEQEEKLLQGIDDLLKKDNIKKHDLKGIVVVTGPGSFSALRIGIATANTLAWALQIPIVGLDKSEFIDYKDLLKISISNLKKNQIILPSYGKDPNINS